MLSHKLLPNNRRFVPAGETEVILRSATKVLIMHSGYALVAWEEAPFFTERERAALAWTEAVTKVGEGHVLASVFEQAHLHFGEKELVDLTLAMIAINGWNRLAIGFRTVPGTYNPVQRRVGESNDDAEASRNETGQKARG
jgi:hypothetical protein